mgnify:FL=1
MATAQEILAKIKENKRKENEKLFKLAETSSNWNSNNLYSSTTNGSLHRLYSIESTLQQEERLYLHWQAKLLSIKLANKKKFVLPLAKQRSEQVYKTLFPKFVSSLTSCTWYVPELVSYIAKHCTYIQQLLDIQAEYLTGITKAQQEVIYSYLLKYKEQHDASNKLDQCNPN